MASKEEKEDKAAAAAAAAAQLQATREALQFLKDLYAQQREDQRPWLETGASALQKQAYLMGLSGKYRAREAPQWTGTRTGTGLEEAASRGGWDRTNYDRGRGDDDSFQPPPDWSRRPGGIAVDAPEGPNEFSRGYASSPLALITGRGRQSAGEGMVRLMAPTGEVRAVSSAQAQYYLAKGAKPV